MQNMTTTMNDLAHFLLLQLNDATFPIGSYSLSWGLETFVQQGFVHDAESACAYIGSELRGSFIFSELLPARLAWEYASDSGKLSRLDELYGASRSPLELREGSRKLASRFLKTTAGWTRCTPCAYSAQYYPVAYGSFCGANGIGEHDALAGFLYSQTSARITTAVKLVPLSQTDGQIILNNSISEFPDLVHQALSFSEDDICRSCPGTDIRAMQHETLYTRLYMS
jgi:urease accessory protein